METSANEAFKMSVTQRRDSEGSTSTIAENAQIIASATEFVFIVHL
jgi:hypothetical protein